jgi:hypothetical protein
MPGYRSPLGAERRVESCSRFASDSERPVESLDGHRAPDSRGEGEGRRVVARPASRARNAALYVLCLCIFFEGASRAALSIDRFFERLALPDTSTGSRLRWVRQRRRSGGLSYRFDVYDATRGWALERSLRSIVAFGSERLSSNSHGLRGATDYDYARTGGKPRIAIFGDSFTFGEEVSDDQTYAAGLQRELPDTELLNFGVHGYGQDQMLLYLQQEGVRYQPDVVVLGFVYEDMTRNMLEFRDYAKPWFTLEGERLVPHGIPVPAPEAVLSAEPWRSSFVDLVTLLRDAALDRAGVKAARSRRLGTALLEEFRRTASATGGRVLFLYLPTHQELVGPASELREREAFLLEFCGEHGVTCLSLVPQFATAVRDGLHVHPLRHWTAREHQLAASAVAPMLRQLSRRAP